jgi:hypothetical protein
VNLFIEIKDHLKPGSHIRSGAGLLTDFVTSFSYKYKEGVENDFCEIELVFETVAQASSFIFRPGINYHVRFGYLERHSQTRDVVIDEIKKSHSSKGITINLTLIPLVDYEGKVMPMSHDDAWDAIAKLLARDIELQIQVGYDRSKWIQVHPTPLNPKEGVEPDLDTKLYHEPRVPKPKRYKLEPSQQNAQGWGMQTGMPMPNFEGGPEPDYYSLATSMATLIEQIAKDAGGLTADLRDGKIIIKDKLLDAPPSFYIQYGSDNLISWDLSEQDNAELMSESQFGAELNEKTKELGLTQVHCLNPGFELPFVYGTGEDGNDIIHTVVSDGEDFYVFAEDVGYIRKVEDPNHIAFLEKRLKKTFNKAYVSHGNSDHEILNMTDYFKYEEGKHTKRMSEIFSEINESKLAELDNAQYQNQDPGKAQIVPDLSEFAPVWAGDVMPDQEGITQVDLFKPGWWVDGYIRERLVSVWEEKYPYSLDSLMGIFMKNTQEMELHRKELSLEIEGDPAVEIGQILFFTGFDQYDTGSYYIEEADHNLSSKGYITKITAYKVPPNLEVFIDTWRKKIGDELENLKQSTLKKFFTQYMVKMGKWANEELLGFDHAGFASPVPIWDQVTPEHLQRVTEKHAPHTELNITIVKAEEEVVNVQK